MSGRRRVVALMVGMAIVGVIAGCSTASSATSPPGGHVDIVAAENFWGSIAAQLGGSKVAVTSIVSDPNADPHDYQSSTSNARAFATANYVILNGAGYDSWAQALLSANPESGRTVLSVADLLGKKEGDNPHFWYSPTYVGQVADRITSDLGSLDPSDAAYFQMQRSSFEEALRPYHDRIAAIKTQFAGRRIAATESIVVYLCDALGLNLISPPEFMKAVAEGNDPPTDTVSEFQRQLQSKQATVLVFNEQTATDVTTNVKKLATQQGVPVVGVTETIQPSDATFEAWMVGELNDIQNALNASALTR